MTAKQFNALGNALLPMLPGFVADRAMLVMKPVGRVLRAIHFDGSSFDARSFYIYAFVMPLFIPIDHIYFNLGIRLRESHGWDRWNAAAHDLMADLRAAVKNQAIPHLAGVDSPEAVITLANSTPGSKNPHIQETIAYSLVLCGKVDEAQASLHKLVDGIDQSVAWQREIAARAGLIASRLGVSLESAHEQLAAWEAETVKNLKLEKLL